MTQKALFTLPIGAGLYTEQSERGAVGRWYKADKVRFRKGLAEKIGGWVRLQPQFLGTSRALKDWTSLDTKKWAAIGTDIKLYLWQDETLYDITPLRDSGTLTAPFDTTMSSDIVTVEHTNHGGQVGDYVRFSGAIAGGGLTIDGEYVILTVPTQNTYTIQDDETASSTASNTGGTPTYEYDIHAGDSSSITATGYGTGPYGREGYGNARTGSTLILGIRVWSLDTWGEDLLASHTDGAIYWWDRSKGTGVRAAALGGDAPNQNKYMVVSQRDRHVLALGAFDFFNNAYDPLLIRWCSTEDLNDWIPTSTNTSGDLRLYSGSKIVAGVRSRLETIIFTDVSVHTMPFVGGFAVFGLNIVGENVSILGPNCAVSVDHRVIFMAESDFYVYDGVLKVVPCDVRNFVYDNLNVQQKEKVYGGLNREFNEVWWFYPSFDPEAWVQQDFSLGLPAGYSLADASPGGTIGYTYTFNSGGWTEIVGTADNNYGYDYTLTNDEPFITPRDAEYAIEFAFNSLGGASTHWVGMSFLRTEISGTIDTDADDCQGIFIECDFFTDAIRIRRKLADGVKAGMDSPSFTDSDFTTVLGSAAEQDVKYIITATFTEPDDIEVLLNGVQVWMGSLSPTEDAVLTGGSAGFHAEPSVTIADEVKFYNFAAGPTGILTASDFDISPIEVNRYVALNYEEWSWTTGKMARTSWADRSPLLEKPYATGTDGYMYKHETGTDDNGAAMVANIESFDMEIPNAGEELMHVDQLIPDFLTLEGSVDVYLTGKKYPGVLDRSEKGPYPVVPGTRKLSTRMRARQIAIKVESTGTGDKWRMGNWRGRAGPHGKRG
jgi:hypothetical protein